MWKLKGTAIYVFTINRGFGYVPTVYDVYTYTYVGKMKAAFVEEKDEGYNHWEKLMTY